jgi:ribosomal protein S12 methylthiotransferase
MGCAKNVVDSEKLMAQLELNGLEITPTIEGADIAVINTCGFIDAAKEESIDMIIEQVTRKGMGRLRKVYAMGCLTERYRRDLEREIPEVDRFFGSHEIERVVHALGAEYKHDLLGERRLTTPRHFAYLKISEGCDNPCAFCAIPLMRGRHVSRPAEEVLAEARLLVRRGVRELIVIGQDTTYYGVDRRGTRQIAGLLRSMTEVEGVEWVRLMYTFPSGFPLDLLEEIAGNPRVCKYVDMPVQHVSDRVLKSMRRGISRRALMNLIETIRGRVPDIALRTTLIVGYPEETEREFEELARFVEEVRFDRLGVFTYSREEGTTAFPLGDPVPPAEKERRRARILELQQEISEERNAALVGTRQKVLLDRTEGELFVGRTERDAPEIDNEVFVTSATPLEIGNFYQIAIDSASEYDLYGKACS